MWHLEFPTFTYMCSYSSCACSVYTVTLVA